MNRFKHGVEPGDYLGTIRKLKNVQRLSGKSLIQKYSVAEHCYYTGILFEYFAEKEKIKATKKEIHFVYRHDILESITGDIQRPAKTHTFSIKHLWESIELILAKDFDLINYTDEWSEKYFSKESLKLFKACDIMELLLFCTEEIKLGNNNEDIQIVFCNCKDYIIDSGFDSIISYLEELNWI